MEEEDTVLAYEKMPSIPSPEPLQGSSPEPIPVCKCLLDADSLEEDTVPERKKLIFSAVTRTQNYLRERRISDLMRFICTKILAEGKVNPAEFTMKLLNQCMLFRAGLGVAPVLFEDRHLEAVVKSFDPGQRGWLSAGQVRRAYTMLGLNPKHNLGEKIPSEVVLEDLRTAQERELYNIISAGTNKKGSVTLSESTESTSTR